MYFYCKVLSSQAYCHEGSGHTPDYKRLCGDFHANHKVADASFNQIQPLPVSSEWSILKLLKGQVWPTRGKLEIITCPALG